MYTQITSYRLPIHASFNGNASQNQAALICPIVGLCLSGSLVWRYVYLFQYDKCVLEAGKNFPILEAFVWLALLVLWHYVACVIQLLKCFSPYSVDFFKKAF